MSAPSTDRGPVPFLELLGLEKSFGDNAVLRGIDLRVERGDVLTIVGGSGSGKSVLLKHMIGLLRADRGSVSVEGVDATAFSETDWIGVRKRIGYVFQGAALFDSLSVFENIAYPIREHERWPPDRIADRVAACLAAVGLPGIEAQMPAALSGGMRKRVGVARAIALEPGAILYDEPTTGLDPANSRRIGDLIRDLQTRLQVTSVVVTHDTRLCRSVSDRVALLAGGVLAAQGSVVDLREDALPTIREFLEGRGQDDGMGTGQEEGRAG